MMLPTARAARGRPAIFATSPYVATRPGGMRRTTVRTRCWKGGISARSHHRERVEVIVARIERRDHGAGAAGIVARLPEIHVARPVEPPAVSVDDDADAGAIGVGRVDAQHDADFAGVEAHEGTGRVA